MDELAAAVTAAGPAKRPLGGAERIKASTAIHGEPETPSTSRTISRSTRSGSFA